MAKSLIDFMSVEDYSRYNELVELAIKAKETAPKSERKPRGPLTPEQKVDRAKAAKAKADATLARLLAEASGEEVAE